MATCKAVKQCHKNQKLNKHFIQRKDRLAPGSQHPAGRRDFAQIGKEAPRGPVEKRDWKLCSGKKNSTSQGAADTKCKNKSLNGREK